MMVRLFITLCLCEKRAVKLKGKPFAAMCPNRKIALEFDTLA